jgi:hypothetical protein
VDCDEVQVNPRSEVPPIIVTPIDPRDVDPDQEFVSPVFDITFADGFENVLDFQVEICLAANSRVSNNKDLCLGYLDETQTPPRWRCQDICLSTNSNGQFCGETTHFTNFALLLGGIAAAGDVCSSSGDYITGSLEGDLILCGICLGICICFALFCAFITQFSAGRRLLLGKEGSRIVSVRKSSVNAKYSFQLDAWKCGNYLFSYIM